MGDVAGLTNTASAAPVASTSSASDSAEPGFDTTMVQSATVYEATQTLPAETSAFDKTVVNDIRGTEPKI